MNRLLQIALFLGTFSAVLAKKSQEPACPKGFKLDKSKNCVYVDSSVYSCKAGEYMQGSVDKCTDFKIVIGNNQWPADTKTTRVWWRQNKIQKTCSKTHNIRPGIYCAKGQNAKTTWDQAHKYCLAAGGRLCTAKELAQGDTTGTGCNYNWKRVWTATPCGIDRFITAPGDKQFTNRIGGVKCTKRNQKIGYVRCCANDEFACEKCPHGLTSSAGAVLESECKCKSHKDGECVIPDKFTHKTCGGGQYRAGSPEGCQSLSHFTMTNTKNDNNKDICVSGASSSTNCAKKMSFKDAESFCTEQGARLCTAGEISSGVGTKETLCGLNGETVWTHTRCSANSILQMVNKNGGKSSCIKMKSGKKKNAYPICCADSGNDKTHNGQYCKSCPPNNKASVSGAMDIYECEPSTGYKHHYPGVGSELEFKNAQKKNCPKGSYSEASVKTCDELSWTNAKKGKDGNVCSNSKLSGKCSGQVSQAQAVNFCESVGARLCTYGEILNNEASDSGCNLDGKRVWTSSPCNEDGGDFITVGGSKRGSKKNQKRCEDSSSSLRHARCCADVETKCKKCPPNSSTDSTGSVGLTSCKCKQGFNGVDGGICSPPTPKPTMKKRTKTFKPAPSRCEVGQFLAGSPLSCHVLGLQVTKNNQLRNEVGKKPCGTFFQENTRKCIGKKTHSAAVDYCKNRGMRLCSGMEIVYRVPQNQESKDPEGCYGTASNQKHFWTLKPCREDKKYEGGKPNDSKRKIYIHTVATPYLGADRDRSERLGLQSIMWPETSDDECVLPGKSVTRHVACCADQGGHYCHTCPKNSCHSDAFPNSPDPSKCPAGLTTNMDCPCDSKNYVNEAVWDNFGVVDTFNYNKKYFRVCVPDFVTDSPTAAPTSAPTKFPTKRPLPNTCEAGYFWNGAAPLVGPGEGQYACNHQIWGSKNLNKKQQIKHFGPNNWKNGNPSTGCRGKCLVEKNVDSSECRADMKLNEIFSVTGVTNSDGTNQQTICTTTDDGGWKFFLPNANRNNLANEEYTKNNCKEVRNGATSYVNCCSKMVSYSEAKDFCTAVGGRLCTADELILSCAERTGCDYDYTWVWSATECKLPNGLTDNDGNAIDRSQSAHIAAPGDARKWERKAPGDCFYKANKNDATSGHKACQKVDKSLCTPSQLHPETNECYAQGMPNHGDGIPFPPPSSAGTGQKTGMGEAEFPKAENWLQVSDRYLYTEAMMDLFDWDKSDHPNGIINTGNTPSDKPNPYNHNDGIVCLPDTGDYPVFTRCCADNAGNNGKLRSGKYQQKDFCTQCPPGLTNDVDTGKDFYTCECRAPKSLDEFGNCS